LEYEGSVTSIDPDSDTFTAQLVDVSGTSPDEEAEFALREITDDKHLVVPGATFSWIIGLQWRKRQSTRVAELACKMRPRIVRHTIVVERMLS
jgi:hypothetical protein